MPGEQRQHRRAETNVLVQFCEDSGDNSAQQYQKGIVGNCSAGGMYIATEHPAPRGSLIRLKFSLDSENKAPLPIQARASVRWVRHVAHPRGMGVEFLEFEGIDAQDFREWITNLLV